MNAILLLAALTSGDAHAWSHTRRVWVREDLPIEWWMGNNQPTSIDWDYVVGTDGGAIQASFDTWVDSAPCANLGAEYMGVRDDHRGGFVADNLNTFSMRDPLDQLDGPTLAATLCLTTGEVVFTKDGDPYRKVYDCDITYSETNDWATWEDVENGQCSNAFSFQSVTTHEIGHLWGLGHSCDAVGDDSSANGSESCDDPDLRYATMYWSTGPCDNYQGGDLRNDDVNGIYALYGPSCTFEATTERFGGAPLEVCFEVECNEPPEGFEWKWGDGTTSTDALDTCHTYEDKGQFSVGLTTLGSGDACGEWETTNRQQAYVLVCGEPEPGKDTDGSAFTGLFTFEHYDGLVYQMINQTDTSVYGCIDQVVGEVYKGGSVSGEPVQTLSAWSPKIEFTEEGTYTVVLNVGGPGGISAGELTIEVEDKRGDVSRGCSAVPATAGLLGIFIGLGAAVRRRRQG